MNEGLPPVPPALPRPRAPEGPIPALGDRLRALRADPRVGAVAVVAVALAAGAFWFRSATATPATSASSASSVSSVSSMSTAASTAATGGAASGAQVQPLATGATSVTAGGSSTVPVAVVVHVAGAVNRPGVVTLPSGSRVVDAVDAAGGGLPDADLDRLNLAALLADGERILVARVGDPPTTGNAGGGVTPQGGVTAVPAGPIDLNAATQADLEELPGIGPTLAAAIITERTRRGGYTDVAQLQQVPGIGEGRYAQIRDLVTV